MLNTKNIIVYAVILIIGLTIGFYIKGLSADNTPQHKHTQADPPKPDPDKKTNISDGPSFTRHLGICDASAAIPINNDHFLVAEDELNELSLYPTNKTSLPIRKFNMSEHLNLKDDQEADIEAVALLNNYQFWITSHGRNKNAKPRPERNQLFATQITGDAPNIQVKPHAQHYNRLLNDLITNPDLNQPQFRFKEIESLAPKKGGINIEGLAATPDAQLLIGFRSPLTDKKVTGHEHAILLPILNPTEIINAQPARFGKPITIDLGGLGVRSITYHSKLKQYLILAGGINGKDKFALYIWTGPKSQTPPRKLSQLELDDNMSAEGLVIYPNRNEILVIYDEGSRERDGTPCKELEDPNLKGFHSQWIDLTPWLKTL